MKKKINFRTRLYCSIVAVLSLFAVCSNDLHAAENSGSGDIPYGIWNVTQVMSEKNKNGNAVKNTFSKAAEVQSVIPCPQKWEIINSEELVMHFPDKKETLPYKLEDGQLVINYLGAIYHYSYSVNNGTMTLTGLFKYGNKEENIIITLKMQN